MGKQDNHTGNNGGSSFGFGGSYTDIMGKIFDTLLAGLLWLVCSIPLITCGAATAALYHTIVRSIKEGTGYAARTFFKSFKGNLKQSLLPWTILLILTVLAYCNFNVMSQLGEGYVALFFTVFYAVAFLILFPVLFYYAAALSRFDMPTSFHLRLAFFMVFRNFGTTLIIYVLALMVIGFASLLPVLVLVLPGPVAWLLAEFMEKGLLRHYPKEEDTSAAQLDARTEVSESESESENSQYR